MTDEERARRHCDLHYGVGVFELLQQVRAAARAEALEEAVEIAAGDAPVASLWMQGHNYVPAAALAAAQAAARAEALEECAALCEHYGDNHLADEIRALPGPRGSRE